MNRYLSTLIAMVSMIAIVATAAINGSAAPQPAAAERILLTPEVPDSSTPGISATTFEAQPAGANTPTRTPTPINVGNFVWDDFDQDGRQDAGEPGLAGVTVQLWNAAKNDLIDSAQTSSTGSYTLIAPTPGDYRVRVLLPSALDSFSPQDQAAGDDLDDSDITPTGSNKGFTDIYTFASNLISITTIDAGIIVDRPPTPTRTPTPINIGNFIWNDLDGDGIQETGEPGVAYVTVQLWNPARTQLITQATTNINGSYTLVAPLPGDYRVRVVLPTGASFTLKDQGGDDLKDSDINRVTFTTVFGFTDVFTIASNVISTTIYDAGLTNVPATPTVTPVPFDGTKIYLPLVAR